MPPRNNENAKKAPAMETPKTDIGQDETPKFYGAAPAVEDIGTDFTFKHQIVWKNAIAYLGFHIVGLVGLLMVLSFRVNPLTTLYTIMVLLIGGVGLTMGAHRYFTHRAFKAKLIPRRILMILFVINGQNSLWEWARDHRQHHKYSDTDADPHNASRGFFFSHVGWLLSRKHPKVFQYGKGIDMSDLEADSWIMFQKKCEHCCLKYLHISIQKDYLRFLSRYFLPIYGLVAILIPCIIPVLLWNEDPIKSLVVCYFARTTLGLNFTWFVNSLAHIYGTRPYDKSILPVQSQFVSIVGIGEGWHNYHHAFPWDYRTSEYGTPYNFTAKVIDYCAKKGWVYDLKAPTEESIKNRVKKTGDNSHEKYGDPTKYSGVETWNNVWITPGNPTYTSKIKPQPIKITREYVLYDTDKKFE
ncbi:acyl-CoA Delta-9 desaturase-like [Lutzomyia longipalpis]|uniref:acyl-CoA Delta-9 desaturase-like n=1 Tax=Lutzomyia longipalpis TaxID=7200 RepID=UPI0024844081|nr:acyl-CoA Delta-9 desaturase-like [Lutzomyia longipalpis]